MCLHIGKMSEKNGWVLGGFFVCRWNLSSYFPCNGTFSSTFGYDTEFCRRHICTTGKGMTAFPAFPDADTHAFNSYKTALCTSVGFFKSCSYSDVTLSNCRPVSGSQASRGTNLFCFSQVLTTSFFCVFLQLFSVLASFLLKSVPV